FDQDPLWQTTMPPQAFDAIAWYHCDHLGTPMELTDPHGNVAWAGQYKAWGEVREERSEWAKQVGMSNPIRFQGQYHDHETRLHYNRNRYYAPKQGRYISRDPISYAGGLNLYIYVSNPIELTDPLGLCSRKLDNVLGGAIGDNLQAHHIIPEQVWKIHKPFFDSIGLGDGMDKKENGVLMPDSEAKAKRVGRMLYHCGSHPIYSASVRMEVLRIKNDYREGVISDSVARERIVVLQNRNRKMLQAPGTLDLKPKRLD
ncbi:RHS repeat domain-containing protein, partial [Pseudomonas sp. AP-1]|uniref:RHS repeat domain-containing protein n=1 Tax=Pseudomonas sp. AP-1 TaxID=3231718 RepID=UPI0035B4692F